MNQKSLKSKLKNNNLTIGCWITISNQIIPEILSQAGFDWLCVDLEHTSIDLNNLESLIISIENQRSIPLVRVGENNPNLIKRVMDIGSHGVIVPNIKSKQEAELAVNSVKYPPEGKRGVGLYRAQGYGKNFSNYLNWLKKESLVIIQIEDIVALENIDEIFSVKGIDAFMVGPYDLSASMNKPGDFENKKYKKALNKILKTAKKYNIPAGFHCVSPDPYKALKELKNNYKFFVFSLDSILLQNAASTSMDIIRKNLKKK